MFRVLGSTMFRQSSWKSPHQLKLFGQAIGKRLRGTRFLCGEHSDSEYISHVLRNIDIVPRIGHHQLRSSQICQAIGKPIRGTRRFLSGEPSESSSSSEEEEDGIFAGNADIVPVVPRRDQSPEDLMKKSARLGTISEEDLEIFLARYRAILDEKEKLEKEEDERISDFLAGRWREEDFRNFRDFSSSFKLGKGCGRKEEIKKMMSDLFDEFIRASADYTLGWRFHIHSSEMEHVIGFTAAGRLQLWLRFIRQQPRTSRHFLSLSDYEKAIDTYRKLFPTKMLEELPVYGHPSEEFVYEIVDGFSKGTYEYDDTKTLLQIKCTGKLYESVPWYYIPQAHVLMHFNHASTLELFCWTPKGISLFRIRRDNVLWGKIQASVTEFWQKHLLPGRKRYNPCMVDALVELADIVPTSRDQTRFDYIRRRCICVACASECLLFKSPF